MQAKGSIRTLFGVHRMKKNSVTLLGITGGSASGKSTLAHKILHALGELRCGILSQDHYYIDQSYKFRGDGEEVNFDHPSALDWFLMSDHLSTLKKGESIEIPIYDFSTHQRLSETTLFYPRELVIVDGTLILSQDLIKRHFNKTVFINTNEDIRFQRRLKRDVQERGREPEGIKKQFFNHVKPMHDLFVEPSKQYAQEIISGHEFNEQWFSEWVVKLLK